MSFTVTQESFESLTACWNDTHQYLPWTPLFVLPAWLKVWWQELGAGSELHLGAIREDGHVVGIAPLLVKEAQAAIVGSPDVCDYLDFVIAPGKETDFYNILLDDLKKQAIHHLDLRPLRPESTVCAHLVNIARQRGDEVIPGAEDVSVELDLPATWEEYLRGLDGKQRHEIGRKLRRLAGEGKVEYRTVKDKEAMPEALEAFFKMFTESRQDKAMFLTDKRESFFRSMTGAMAEISLLRFGVLDLDKQPVAMVLYFDYKDSVYLYNSGYNPDYSSLSVGVLCKVLCIQECIQQGKKKFDFLKGDETYKYHLGGKAVSLYNCQINIK
ncbi:MAG: GNAT family N-acetyltransferase [Chloroflexota bacterium]